MNLPHVPARRPLPPAFADELGARFGARFSTTEAVRAHHGHDESHFPDMLPDAVVWPHDTAEVVAIVEACCRHRVPIVPFGAGSSLEGHILPLHGGISVDFSEMNKVLAVHGEDMDAVVQPGITRKQLNTALHGSGLFFPVDPGADASLGGMAATRASGTNAVRYGTMRDNVLGMEVVLADGRVIRTGGRARKSSSGYDLTRLMIGSEGTLGLITELIVRLHPLPEAVSAAVCAFPDVASAVRTVIQTIQLGVPVARIELLDELTVQAINRYSKTTLRESPMLFFEFHGSKASVEEQAQTVQEIARDNSGQDFEWATHPEDRTRLWAARHDVYFSCIALRPGCRGLTTDVCVPISRLADCIAGAREDIAASGLIAPIVGHVGDGNFHTVVLVDPDDGAEIQRAEALNRRIVERALAMGGTCTGEHGIGFGKQDFLVAEHGRDAVDAMRALKRALDPDGLLNPGKIVPAG
ncbi:FAD-binding oxidoreductase [Aromatoleum bremense]|uniref:D-lactate dehydrogenase (cytochrome) n=1 Tax=Aromatoleum bremense TaxID=76115 RepID=A0ABX1NSK4_9RHOO|nr:FAD-linked oxidase C-terminal domain-containing protein [Aromatoleum bremense]NMG14983.1 FAD-binding protein [Aromatoleum bremense]QTQ32311.1 FAD-dependent oxidoreductase [Aromatoleum bremense]